MCNESFTTEMQWPVFCASPIGNWGVTTAVSYCIRFFFKFVIKIKGILTGKEKKNTIISMELNPTVSSPHCSGKRRGRVKSTPPPPIGWSFSTSAYHGSSEDWILDRQYVGVCNFFCIAVYGKYLRATVSRIATGEKKKKSSAIFPVQYPVLLTHPRVMNAPRNILHIKGGVQRPTVRSLWLMFGRGRVGVGGGVSCYCSKQTRMTFDQ